MTEEHLTAKDGFPESELHAAAWEGNIDQVRERIKAGADLNWRDSIGETALSGTAGLGHSDVVRLLLEHGARHDLPETETRYTPLHWAARNNLETVKTLVSFDADKTAAGTSGQFPIDAAHSYGKGNILAYLKTVGPDIRSRR